MRIGFRFRWIPFIATVVAVAIGIALGQWQTRRAEQKQALEHMLEVRESAPALDLDIVLNGSDKLDYRHVSLKGEFIQDWPLYLDNRSYHGNAGFYVLMPFKLLSGKVALVARGWIKRDISDRVKLPVLMTPPGQIELDGIVVDSVGKVFQLGSEETQFAPGAILQSVKPATFAAVSKLPIQPLFIQQRNDTHDDLVRDWPRPALDIDRHRGYTVTWYGLALMAAIFYLVTGLKRYEPKQ